MGTVCPPATVAPCNPRAAALIREAERVHHWTLVVYGARTRLKSWISPPRAGAQPRPGIVWQRWGSAENPVVLRFCEQIADDTRRVESQGVFPLVVIRSHSRD